MRESFYAERYAQRAVEKRRELEDRVRQQNRLGEFAVIGYLAEGAFLEKGLDSLSLELRTSYILKNSEMIASSDGAEGVHIVWCPNRAVLTHRLLSLELRREFGNKHYLKTWWRDLFTSTKDDIRASVQKLLESRVNARAEQAKQGALPLDLSYAELEVEMPQFINLM